MAISKVNQDFIMRWKEQRADGFKGYFFPYWLGWFIVCFMSGVVLGIFLGARYISATVALVWINSSICVAAILSASLWAYNEARFKKILASMVKD